MTIGNGVTSIGSSAFAYCTNLTSVTIGNSVTSIGYSAFSNCTSLTSVTIPDSVTSIGSEAFSNCTSLTSVTIGNSVTSIGNYAFRGCTSLTSINVSENNTAYKSIDGNLYSKDGKTLIQYAIGKTDSSFIIPNVVMSIGNNAFYNCTSLTSVTIGNSVTSIGSWAFEGCFKLVEVINHSTLNITAGSSNYGYVGYYAKEVHTGESKIVNVNGYLFITSGGVNYLLGYVGDETELTLPDDYNGENYVINDNAFEYCTSLTSVTIGNSVTSIGSSAFYGCTSLTSVTIPDSVTSIGGSAFYGCTILTSVTIGNSVTNIGYAAFRGCTSLTSITFKGTVAQWNAISKGSFWESYVPATVVVCSDGSVSI